MVINKLAIIGSRDFKDYEFFKTELEKVVKEKKLKFSKIVSGGAKGIDKMAAQWSKENNKILIEYLADYKKYFPKAAPKKRNSLIVKDADAIMAFWNKKSGGTKDAIDKAIKSKKPLWLIKI